MLTKFECKTGSIRSTMRIETTIEIDLIAPRRFSLFTAFGFLQRCGFSYVISPANSFAVQFTANFAGISLN